MCLDIKNWLKIAFGYNNSNNKNAVYSYCNTYCNNYFTFFVNCGHIRIDLLNQ